MMPLEQQRAARHQEQVHGLVATGGDEQEREAAEADQGDAHQHQRPAPNGHPPHVDDEGERRADGGDHEHAAGRRPGASR